MSVTTARAGVSDYYTLRKPAGDGPFPAVIVVGGCGGYGGYAFPYYRALYGELVAAGFVVVKIDFLKISSVSACASTVPYFHYLVPRQEVVGEIDQAIADLRQDSFVDASRISLLGLSFGGGAALQALADSNPARTQIHSVVVYYPDCYELERWSVPTPTLIFFGGADTVAKPSLCRDVLATMRNGTSVKTVEFSGASHGFNFPNLPPPPGLQTPFGPMAYDADAAERARAAALAFLKQ